MAHRLRPFLALALTLLLFGVLVAAVAFVRLWQVPQTARLEFDWQSEAPARLQVYYDSGQGLNESESVAVWLPGLPEFQKVRLDLPAMYLGALRLDLTDSDRPTRVRDLTLAVAPFAGDYPLTALVWTPNEDVERIERQGNELQIVPRAGVNDPQIVHVFSPRLRTFTKTSGKFWSTLPKAMAWGFVASALAALGIGLWRGWAAWVPPLRRNPWKALVACAALATSLALYPLWLDGRSLVSPHVGAAMLYGGPPYVAGSTSDETEQAYGADVGALFWSHLPAARVVAESYAAGEWPYWNRYNSCGVPLLGQGQSMAGDPLQMWVNAMGGASWAWDIKFAIARFLFSLGLAGSTWLLWGRLRGAAVVALATPFVAFFNFRFNHPGTFSNSYAPLLLLAWIGLAKAQTRSGILASLGGIVASSWILLSSGTVKEAYLSFVCFTLMGVVGVWIDAANQGAMRRIKRGASWAVVALLIGVSAPLWFSFLSTQAASFTVYQTPRAHTIPPGFFLGLFDDLFPRLASPQHNVYTPAGNGVLWVGLWAALLPVRQAPPRGWMVGLAMAAVLCLALAFSLVPKALILAVPFLRNVTHIDGLFSSLALVPLWLLAGFGFNTLLSDPVVSRRRTVGLPLAVAGLGLVACVVTLVLRETGPLAEFLRSRAAYLPDVLTWCAGLGLIYGVVAWRRVNDVAVVLLGVGCGLLLFRHGLHSPSARDVWPTLSVPGPRVPLDQPSASVRWVQSQLHEPARVLGTDNEMIPGISCLFGLEGINGPDALMVRMYRELLVAAGLTDGEDWRVVWTTERLASHRRLLDMLGVRYVFTHAEEIPTAAAMVRRQRLDLNVFERPSAWPRAFFVSSYRTYRGVDDFVEQLSRHTGEPAAWIEESDVANLASDERPTASGSAIPAYEYQLTPNVTRFRIEAPGPGLAVLQEANSPGAFRARLNGSAAPLVRVNHAFKAVEIPAKGSFVVEVEAAPPGMTTAGWVSLISLVLGGGWGIILFRKIPVGPHLSRS